MSLNIPGCGAFSAGAAFAQNGNWTNAIDAGAAFAQNGNWTNAIDAGAAFGKGIIDNAQNKEENIFQKFINLFKRPEGVSKEQEMMDTAATQYWVDTMGF